MTDSAPYREDIAVVGYTSGRVLLVKMAGYSEKAWRLPQGPKGGGGEGRVIAILEDLVGCKEVGAVRDTGERGVVEYDIDERSSYDERITAKVFRGKRLEFYIAELLCTPESFAKGSRVDSIKLVRPAELKKYVSIEELMPLNRILGKYVIDEDAFFSRFASGSK